MGSTDVYALSIHADYRCRHSGACCSADWDVPIELPVYRALKEAVDGGRLQPQASARHLSPFIVEPDLPEDAAAMLERTDIGECVFLERGTKLCIIHRDLGEPALPATCRYFPRLAVRDDRGTFITLSHFCPTAASMLFRDDCPLAITSGPHVFPPGEYEGLVVTGDDLLPHLDALIEKGHPLANMETGEPESVVISRDGGLGKVDPDGSILAVRDATDHATGAAPYIPRDAA